jgi:hypothetical protein
VVYLAMPGAPHRSQSQPGSVLGEKQIASGRDAGEEFEVDFER